MGYGFVDTEHANPSEVVMNFRFQINGTSDPDNAVGRVVSDISRASQGVFNVTLKAEYRYTTMVTCFCSIENDPDKSVQPTSWNSSTGVLVVTTSDDTQTGDWAAQDPADDTWVHVQLTLCKRSDQAPSVSI